jgi:ParB-like chromosome segregation protein Spo0J
MVEDGMTQSRYLKTDMVPLDQLTPFPGNAKRGRVDKILESIAEHGQYRSLVVRHTPEDTLVVLAGNHTMLALAEHGAAQARCEIIACDDLTAKKINLIDNKASDDGEYDQLALAELLRGLEGDYSGTGFEDDEVADILEALEADQPAEVLAYAPQATSWNDTPEDVERRVQSHGGHESTTMASRGIRDIMLALPSAQADELGQLIMKLRESWGALSQGDVVLRACRVAVAVVDREAIEQGAADCMYSAGQSWRPGDAAGE